VVTEERPAPEVEPPITIGVLGAHSTGKSTFLARLAHELRRRHVQVATVADLGEQAQRNGMPILFNHTWASTLWFVTKGISQELEAWAHAEVVLVDRAILTRSATTWPRWPTATKTATRRSWRTSDRSSAVTATSTT